MSIKITRIVRQYKLSISVFPLLHAPDEATSRDFSRQKALPARSLETLFLHFR